MVTDAAGKLAAGGTPHVGMISEDTTMPMEDDKTLIDEVFKLR